MANPLTLTMVRRGNMNEWGRAMLSLAPRPEGQAGRALWMAAEKAFAHLAHTSRYGQWGLQLFDETPYQRVPPRRALVAKVRQIDGGDSVAMPTDPGDDEQRQWADLAKRGRDSWSKLNPY